jgi:hypothetical protein
VNYSTSSTYGMYLDIIACLCVDTSYCNYDETTTISENYQLASCNCPDQYAGMLIK